MDKLEVPRRRVRKNWYVGLHPDPVDRSHPDVHDDLLVEEASAMNSMSHVNGSMPETNTSISSDNSVNASKLEDEGKLDSIQSDQYNGSSININNNTKHDISMENVTTDNTTHIQRRLLEETDGKGAQDGHSETTTNAGATVENDQDLEEEADSSFDLFRDPEELADEYNYDYDDYVDESMWGDENWTEENHEKLEDYVSIDSHILCTPVSVTNLFDFVYQLMLCLPLRKENQIMSKARHLAFRDEEGKHFWVEMEIVDKYRVPSGFQGPYNVTTTLLVPGNYQGERRIVVNQVYDRPGKQRLKLPTVPVRTTGTVIVEMVDKNGLYFSDEFSLTFHMYYYKLLKWLLVLPMLGMFGILVILGPQERAPLPSFSRNID
ncbi:hypothetical protein BHE74_00012255 [Ensete ventricosum]|nr:hypothetical protein BHE74_00012255 [Ensete ventricosum]